MKFLPRHSFNTYTSTVDSSSITAAPSGQYNQYEVEMGSGAPKAPFNHQEAKNQQSLTSRACSPAAYSDPKNQQIRSFLDTIKADLKGNKKDNEGFPEIANVIINLGTYIRDNDFKIDPALIREMNELVVDLLNNAYFIEDGQENKLWAVHVDAIWLAHEMRKKNLDKVVLLQENTQETILDIGKSRMERHNDLHKLLKHNFKAIGQLWKSDRVQEVNDEKAEKPEETIENRNIDKIIHHRQVPGQIEPKRENNNLIEENEEQNELNKQIKDYDKELKQLNGEIKNKNLELEQKNKELKATLEETNKELEGILDQKKFLESQVEVMSNKLSDLHDESKILEEKNCKQKLAYDASSKLFNRKFEEQKGSLERAQEATAERIQALEAEIKNIENARDQIQRNLKADEYNYNQFKEKTKKHTKELEESLNEIIQEIKKLEKTNQEIGNNLNESQQEKRKIIIEEELIIQSRIAEEKQILSQLTEFSAALERKNNESKETLNRTEENLKFLLEQAEENLKFLLEQAEEINNQLINLNKEFSELQSNNNNLKAANENELKLYNAKIVEQKLTLEKLQNELLINNKELKNTVIKVQDQRDSASNNSTPVTTAQTNNRTTDLEKIEEKTEVSQKNLLSANWTDTTTIFGTPSTASSNSALITTAQTNNITTNLKKVEDQTELNQKIQLVETGVNLNTIFGTPSISSSNRTSIPTAQTANKTTDLEKIEEKTEVSQKNHLSANWTDTTAIFGTPPTASSNSAPITTVQTNNNTANLKKVDDQTELNQKGQLVETGANLNTIFRTSSTASTNSTPITTVETNNNSADLQKIEDQTEPNQKIQLVETGNNIKTIFATSSTASSNSAPITTVDELLINNKELKNTVIKVQDQRDSASNNSTPVTTAQTNNRTTDLEKIEEKTEVSQKNLLSANWTDTTTIFGTPSTASSNSALITTAQTNNITTNLKKVEDQTELNQKIQLVETGVNLNTIFGTPSISSSNRTSIPTAQTANKTTDLEKIEEKTEVSQKNHLSANWTDTTAIFGTPPTASSNSAPITTVQTNNNTANLKKVEDQTKTIQKGQLVETGTNISTIFGKPSIALSNPPSKPTAQTDNKKTDLVKAETKTEPNQKIQLVETGDNIKTIFTTSSTASSNSAPITTVQTNNIADLTKVEAQNKVVQRGQLVENSANIKTIFTTSSTASTNSTPITTVETNNNSADLQKIEDQTEPNQKIQLVETGNNIKTIFATSSTASSNSAPITTVETSNNSADLQKVEDQTKTIQKGQLVETGTNISTIFGKPSIALSNPPSKPTAQTDNKKTDLEKIEEKTEVSQKNHLSANWTDTTAIFGTPSTASSNSALITTAQTNNITTNLKKVEDQTKTIQKGQLVETGTNISTIFGKPSIALSNPPSKPTAQTDNKKTDLVKAETKTEPNQKIQLVETGDNISTIFGKPSIALSNPPSKPTAQTDNKKTDLVKAETKTEVIQEAPIVENSAEINASFAMFSTTSNNSTQTTTLKNAQNQNSTLDVSKVTQEVQKALNNVLPQNSKVLTKTGINSSKNENQIIHNLNKNTANRSRPQQENLNKNAKFRNSRSPNNENAENLHKTTKSNSSIVKALNNLQSDILGSLTNIQ